MAYLILGIVIAVLIAVVVFVFLKRGDKALIEKAKIKTLENKQLKEENKTIDKAVKDLEKDVKAKIKKEVETNNALEKTVLTANNMDELIAMHRKNKL